MAADEKIGEADILSRYCQLAIVRERRGQESTPGRGVAFRFLFAYVSIAFRAAVVKAVRLESSVRIMSHDCNLKIHNTLRRTFREQNRLRPLQVSKTARPGAPGLVRTSFCYNRTSLQST
jgi:hypothetical protein